jgi:HEAT repeat protein
MQRVITGRRLLVLAAAAAALACGRGDLESPDPERRAAAVRAVRGRGREQDLSVLLVAQRDGSPVVRRAAAEVFAAWGGTPAADALGTLLADPDPGVVAVAARGLAGMPALPRARQDLLDAYVDASPAGRAAVADALESIGTSLREAVEAEARALWERNVAALGTGGSERAGAAEELGVSGRAEAVSKLLPLVDPNRNPDRRLAAAAARGLGEAGDWSARAHLEALLGEPDAGLAEAAAAALGRLGDPGAAAALSNAAAEGSGRIAAAAADALSMLPQASEVGVVLCDLALRTSDPAVAARAARQTQLREAECPERLFLARIGRPGAEVALAAIGELGLAAAAAEAASQRILPLLDPSRGEPALRIAASRALGRLRAPGAATPVLARAAALQAKVAAARARGVAGKLPDAAAPGSGGAPEARLAATLTRAPGLAVGANAVPEASARELGALASAAGRLRAPGAEGLLVPLASDPAAPVRAGAIEGLGALGSDAALAACGRALEDPDPSVRFAAAAGLAGLGPRAAPALARAAGAAPPEDVAWRVVLARALGEAGAGDAVPALTGLLQGASAAAAAQALGRTGAPAAVAPLVEWLSRPDASARVEVIEALAQLVARDAAPAIAVQLTADRAEVRAAAARALGRLGHEPASKRLEALRSDYAGRVRRAAVEALAKLPAGAPRMRP